MGNTVTIKGREFKVRNSMRAMFIFEHIAQKPFKVETALDNFLFLYSIILSSNPDNILSWDEFIDAIDEDNKIFDEINLILKEAKEVEKLLESSEDDDKEDGSQKKK